MNEKINVLFVTIQLATIGGSEKLIYNLASKLDRNLFNPSVAWFQCDKTLSEFNDLGIPLYYVPKTKRFDLFTMQKLANIINDNDIHVVNAHHFMSMIYSYYGCKIKNHIKLIYTEHSEWEIEQIDRKWKKIGSFLLKRADRAVGVSEVVSKKISNQFKMDSAKVLTIQNGVELNSPSNSIEKLMLRKKLKIADDEKVIGIVANFKKVKNHIFLLKAFSELAKGCKGVKLLLIGEGEEGDPENSEQEVRKFVNENGLVKNVLFLGYRSDILKLLSIMDIFCLTSFKEGLPISLIEAMAAGLPVIGTDVVGIKDVVINEKNGCLVQLDDVRGLMNALNTLLGSESLRQNYGRESKSMATNAYSLERCIIEYQNMFTSSLGNK